MKRNIVRTLILGAATLALASQAALAGQVADKDLPPVLKALTKTAQGVVKERLEPLEGFDAPLDAWKIRLPNQSSPIIVFTTRDGKYLVGGALVDSDMSNWTLKYAQAYLDLDAAKKSEQPKVDNPEALLEKVSKRPSIGDGPEDAKHKLYVFFEPNCHYCNLLWRAAQKMKPLGVRFEYIPVGFLRPESAGQVASLMAAEDPNAMLAKHETGEQKLPVSEVTPEVQEMLAANQALMRSAGSTGTPTIVYRDAEGNVQVLRGMVPVSTLSKSLGIPVPDVSDDSALYPRFK